MATREAVAIMRDRALSTITEQAAAISDRLNVAAPVLLDYNRDPDYLHAARLTAIAAWLTGVAAALPEQPEEKEDGDDGRETQKPQSRRK